MKRDLPFTRPPHVFAKSIARAVDFGRLYPAGAEAKRNLRALGPMGAGPGRKPRRS